MSRAIAPMCLLLVLAGCEDKPAEPAAPEPAMPEEAKQAEPAAEEPAPEPPPAGEAPDKTLTPDENGVVHLTGDDNMRYNADRIEVKAGETVKIELKHVGTQAVDAMGHNIVVLKPDTDTMQFALKGADDKANDYIPQEPEPKGKVIAHSKLLGGGETDTIEFELPGPGEYPFVCTFPGHAALMKGVLVAK